MGKFIELGMQSRRMQSFDAKSSRVVLGKHTPQWAEFYQRAKHEIHSNDNVKPHVLAIHHVGSTSIPNLDAKPIIDILIDVPAMDAADKIIPSLEDLGYEHLPQEREYENRRFLRKYISDDENYHVHITTVEGNEWRECLLIFRNHLISHPDKVEEYVNLKRQLAQQYADDRATYAREKDAFIKPIVEAERDRMRRIA